MTPTAQQLKLLKLLAAGARLRPTAGRATYELVIPPSPAVVFRVRIKTVGELHARRWIDWSGQHWAITPAGRELTEVGAHVRAFAGNTPPRTTPNLNLHTS